MLRFSTPRQRHYQEALREVGNLGVPIINGAPMYDPQVLSQISQEYDLDESEGWLALFLASATLDGAYENENGGIHALQTACNELGYNEHLTRSKEMDKAEYKNILKTISFYHKQGVTLANSPEKSDLEIKRGPEKLARWLIVLRSNDIDRVMDIMQDKFLKQVQKAKKSP